MIIYKWTHKISGKVYIGQSTKTLDHRIRMHINTTNTGPTLPIHNAIRKYGKDAFIIETITTAKSLEELNQLEIHYIKECDSLAPSGYNLKFGGNNHFWHPDSRAKASKSAKARMQADNGAQFKAALAKGRKALKGRPAWNKGKQASNLTKQRLSESHKGQLAWNKTAIYCIETGEIFNSLKEAALKLKLQSSKICNVLKGKRKHTGGLTFQYLKD